MRALVACCLLGFFGQPAAADPPPAGTWEGVIGYPRRPIVLSVDFQAAAARLDAAGSTPLPVREVTVEGARLRFQVPFGSEGLRFEGEAQGSAIRGTALGGERRLPFWLERLPEPSPSPDRVEGWRQDFTALRERFLRYDRSFDDRERAAFRSRLDRLARSLASRSDAEVMVEVARAVALAGNA